MPWPALALAAIVLLPFLGKAYTIDDPVFLRMAQHVSVDPLHPASVELVWSNSRRGEAAMPFLPDARIAGYVLLPLALAGWKEWAGHLLMLGYFMATVFGVVALARRLGLSPWSQQAAALLTASAPVALGMAGTLAPDIPATMFAVWGVERLVAFRDSGRVRVGVAAAGLLALACLSRVHLVGLLGLAGLWALRQPRGTLIAVGSGLVAATAGLLVTRDPGTLVGSLSGQGSWSPAVVRLLPNLIAFFVLAFTITPLLLALVPRSRGWQPSGLLWLWLLLPLPTLIYLHFSSKFLLPMVPAAAIIAAHALAELRLRSALVAVTAVWGVALGLLVLGADARMANGQRTAAAALIRPRVAAGHTVWYAGHWGFHWYAEAAGAVPVTIEPPWPRPGDILVASMADEPRMLCFIPRVEIEAHGDMRPGPQVMSKRANAGFYSNFYGQLPLGWAPPDTRPFVVYRVTGSPRGVIDAALRPSYCGPSAPGATR